MVCIAAFIILIVIGLFVAIVSIFKREVGKTYLKMMKKALGCVSKKVRLQKCETGFKEDVKNTVLSRVIVKHPKWVKPLSIIIEIVSVIIVVVTVWALLTAVKSLLALWALGTCNVTKPEACSLSTTEVCSIDKSEPTNIFESTGRWFEEWGDIFAAIPDKFRDWNPEQFDFVTINIPTSDQTAPIAIDILDPGCSACLKSYQNQKNSGFFDKHNTRVVVFAIQDSNNEFKFQNSETIVRYIYSAAKINEEIGSILIDHIYAERTEEEIFYKPKGSLYQTIFNHESCTKEKVIEILDKWAKEAGLTDEQIKTIHETMEKDEITDIMKQNRKVVEEDVHVKGIPTMLYDDSRHTGTFQE